MVGLPGQTLGDLAGDVAFFKKIGANMIGMVRAAGPGWGLCCTAQMVFTTAPGSRPLGSHGSHVRDDGSP